MPGEALVSVDTTWSRRPLGSVAVLEVTSYSKASRSRSLARCSRMAEVEVQGTTEREWEQPCRTEPMARCPTRLRHLEASPLAAPARVVLVESQELRHTCPGM